MCTANPALCLPLTALSPSSINPAVSLTWFIFYPSASSLSLFPQPSVFVPVGDVSVTPAVPAGYQLTVSLIFFNTPSGYCVLGSSFSGSQMVGTQMWYTPGTAATATLAYGTSTNLGYSYAAYGETRDQGCAWYGP